MIVRRAQKQPRARQALTTAPTINTPEILQTQPQQDVNLRCNRARRKPLPTTHRWTGLGLSWTPNAMIKTMPTPPTAVT
jgi:hypothetical protein